MTNRYLRTIYGIDKEGNAGSLQVDVYDILDAYPTKNPALDHLVKKALCPGQRGHKDLLTDLDDIIKSAQRAKAMLVNKMACTAEVTVPMDGESHPLCEARVESVVKPTTRQVFPDIRGANLSDDGIAASVAEAKELMGIRPSTFTGKTLCYYPDKLQAEGILRTFLELAQTAGIATRAVERADHVSPNGVLVDNKNPSYKTVRLMAEKGIAIYGVREANVILRGHIADKQSTAKMVEATAASHEAEPVAPTKTSEGYDFSFSDRPGSFNNAIIYLVERVDAGAVERLEREAARCDTVIEYVRHKGDCPKGAIVIHGNNNRMPLDGHQWHFTVDQAITILVNDQKGKTANA